MPSGPHRRSPGSQTATSCMATTKQPTIPVALTSIQNINGRPAVIRSALRHLVAQGHPPHRPGDFLLRIPSLIAGPVRASAYHLPCLYWYRWRRVDDRRTADRERRRPAAREGKVPGHYRESSVHSWCNTRMIADLLQLLGRRGRYREWHWPGDRRCSVVQVGGLVAMDIPHEHALDRAYDPRRDILHAAEEG